LAHLLLKLDGNNNRSIKRRLRSTTTDTLRLNKHIPTHMAYITTWVDDSGELQRRKDIYGHDKKLRAALFSENTLLNTLGSSIVENSLQIAASE